MKLSNPTRVVVSLALIGLAGCQLVAGLEERQVAAETPPDGLAGAAGAGAGAAGAGAGGVAGEAGSAAAGTGGTGSAGEAGAGGKPWSIDDGSPPPRPDGTAGEAGGDVVSFIAQRLFLGQRNEDLTVNPAQWKNYGFNWDQTCTSQDPATGKPQNEACKRPLQTFPGIADGGYYDGQGCRDNAFGGALLPLISTLQGNPEVGLDQEIVDGASTFMLRLSDLSPFGDDPYVPGELFFTAKRDTLPVDFSLNPPQTRLADVASAAYKFLPATGGPAQFADWPEDGSFPTPAGKFVGMSAKARYPDGYVRDHIWVSGDLGASATRTFFPFGGYVAEVEVSAVVLMVQLDPENHARALRSQFAAVVNPQSFVDIITSPRSNLFKCNAAVPAATVAAYITQTSDLKGAVANFNDPTQTCDRVSMGAGIQWAPTVIADVPKLVPATKFECIDGMLKELPLDGSGGAGGAGAGGAAGAAGAGGDAGAGGLGGGAGAGG